MNVLEARVVLRDRAFLDVIDLAVRFFLHHGRAYAKVAAVVLPLAYLVTWAVAAIAGWPWAWAVAVLLSPLAAAPFTALASRLLFEPTAPVYDVLAGVVAVAPRLLGARLLQLFALATGTLACASLPSIWIIPVCFYVNEVIVLERATLGVGALRLRRLLSAQSIVGWLFLTALVPWVVVIGDVVGRSVIEDVFQVGAPPSIILAKGSVLGLAAFWWYVPFEATCRFFLYINTRTRTEGWDVQTRFAAIVARAGEDAREREREERGSILPGRAA